MTESEFVRIRPDAAGKIVKVKAGEDTQKQLGKAHVAGPTAQGNIIEFLQTWVDAKTLRKYEVGEYEKIEDPGLRTQLIDTGIARLPVKPK